MGQDFLNGLVGALHFAWMSAPLIDLPFDAEANRFVRAVCDAHFDPAATHLQQALRALSREEWESSNAQMRTFLEALCVEIANHISEDEILGRRIGTFQGAKKGGEAKKLIESSGFLDADEATLLRAASALLHKKGAHPGRSSRVDAIAKAELVLAIGGVLLERHAAKAEARRRNLFWMENLIRNVFGSIASGSPVDVYNAPDLRSIRLTDAGEPEDEILLECLHRYTREAGLEPRWLEEFREAMEKWGYCRGLVVTDRTVGPDDLVREAEGVWRSKGPWKWDEGDILVVELRRDEPDMALERLKAARDLFVSAWQD